MTPPDRPSFGQILAEARLRIFHGVGGRAAKYPEDIPRALAATLEAAFPVEAMGPLLAASHLVAALTWDFAVSAVYDALYKEETAWRYAKDQPSREQHRARAEVLQTLVERLQTLSYADSLIRTDRDQAPHSGPSGSG